MQKYRLILNEIEQENARLLNKNLRKEDMSTVAHYIMSPGAKKLKQLYLDSNPIIGDEGGKEVCSALKSSIYCTLEVLSLSCTGIGIETIKSLAEYLKSPSSSLLLRLNLFMNKRIRDYEIHILSLALSCNSSVNELNIGRCDFGYRGAVSLQHLVAYSQNEYTITVNFKENPDLLSKRINMILRSNTALKKIEGVIQKAMHYYPCSSTSLKSTEMILNSVVSKRKLRKILRSLWIVLAPLPPFPMQKSLTGMENNDRKVTQKISKVVDAIGNDIDEETLLFSSFKCSIAVYLWRIEFIRGIIHSN